MKESKNNFYSIVGFLILGVFILTGGKGINLKKLDNIKYLEGLYQNGKQIIIKESSKTIKNIKETDLFKFK